MITEDYVSFKIAKLLKEKGFNEPCDNYYDKKGSEKQEPQELTWDEMYYSYDKFLKAPTHQMAMKWLRKEKNIIIVIQPEYFNVESKCSAWGVDIWADDNYEKLQGDFPSYEDAVESALKYSLENLI